MLNINFMRLLNTLHLVIVN